jgi:hypothetical protein
MIHYSVSQTIQIKALALGFDCPSPFFEDFEHHHVKVTSGHIYPIDL